MWTTVTEVPLSFADCRNRTAQALAAEGFGNLRDFGNGFFGFSPTTSASLGCIHGQNGRTVLFAVTAGPIPIAGEARERLLARMAGSPAATAPPFPAPPPSLPPPATAGACSIAPGFYEWTRCGSVLCGGVELSPTGRFAHEGAPGNPFKSGTWQCTPPAGYVLRSDNGIINQLRQDPAGRWCAPDSICLAPRGGVTVAPPPPAPFIPPMPPVAVAPPPVPAPPPTMAGACSIAPGKYQWTRCGVVLCGGVEFTAGGRFSHEGTPGNPFKSGSYQCTPPSGYVLRSDNGTIHQLRLDASGRWCAPDSICLAPR